MITNITLENFKCFHKVEINPKLVTLFIGPNGTGKSGVLQALLLLKQSRDPKARLDLSGKLVDILPDEFMLHGAQSRTDGVGLSLSGTWKTEIDTLESPVTFHIALGCAENGELTTPARESIRFRRDGREIAILMEPGVGVTETQNGIRTTHRLVPSGLREHLRQVPTTMMLHLKTVPAARGLPRQIYRLGSSGVDDITMTAGLSQQEDEVVSTLAYSGSRVSQVSDWMKQVTGVGFQTELVPSQSIRPISKTCTRDVSLTAEGFGTNALVQLLFELARATEGATILMEEPEIHLHPKAQAELTSVIVEEAKASNKQVIMTTHSEHIANRLLTLVAEREISPEEVAIYSFEKDDGGVCSASEIEVTPRGQVKAGLKSFFEAHMEEMRRYGDALRAQI